MASRGSSMAPAGNDLFDVHGERGDIVRWNTELPGQSSVIGHTEALAVVLGSAHHNGVHVDAGNLHQPGVQCAALHNLFHLHDDDAAGVLGGLTLGGNVQRTNLAVDGAVAVFISIGGTDEAYIDGNGLIEQALLPVNVHQLDKVLMGAGVSLPPPSRGSTNVFRPTWVMVPMLWAAMSRYIWVMTP